MSMSFDELYSLLRSKDFTLPHALVGADIIYNPENLRLFIEAIREFRESEKDVPSLKISDLMEEVEK